ncbi:MAG TPA: diaminopimelate epimerase [Ruminococcus sp.]|nr:diaminopimelate epimerase [Ruminococcus sp.]MDY3844399.1 diaminopimelate epimerase [Ruminococcus sp.]
MNFTKMHGIGNDYIYVNCFEETVDNPEELSIKLSRRHYSVGSDGLVLIMPSDKADFRMRIFNADGSEAKMCGNATRCIGKYVYERGLTNKTSITLETNSGIKKLSLTVNNGKVAEIEVDMGKVILKPSEIPVSAAGDDYINRPLEINGVTYGVTCVSVGNPHAVVFVNNTESVDIEKTGPLFENNPIFPDRINTEFIQVIDDHTLKMRVWERGSGETYACGTGACASVAAAVLNNICPHDSEITVMLKGGNLKITYKSDGTIMMKGGASFVYDGIISDEFLMSE